MATSPPSQQIPQTTQDLLAKLNDTTNNMATVVADLRTRISTGMNQQDVDAVDAKLGEIETRLTSIAADPAQPIPAGPPLAALRKK